MKRTLSVLLSLAAALLASACALSSPPIPAQAHDREWVLEDISGKGVVDMSHSTLTITSDGKLAGNSGCNRYVGNFSSSGSRLAVAHVAGTRMACPPALMEQEKSFLHTLEKAASMRIRNGLLLVFDVDGREILRFHPAE